MHSTNEFLTRWFEFGVRRDAAAVNRGFLGWLDRRREPGRPFFAFLNYLDAHTPYLVPQGAGTISVGSPRRIANCGSSTICGLPATSLPCRALIWTWHATATTTVSHTWTRVLANFLTTGAPWAARSDVDPDHFGSWRGTGRARSLHARREPLCHGDPRTAVSCPPRAPSPRLWWAIP